MKIIHQVARKFRIDAGHRIYGHEGKCASLHGHSYTFKVIAIGNLDDLGRVIDFSVMKEVIGDWIEDNLDHAMILWKDDPVVGLYMEVGGVLENDKLFVLDNNPTAENLGAFILMKSNQLLKESEVPITVIAVDCEETPNCSSVSLRADIYED